MKIKLLEQLGKIFLALGFLSIAFVIIIALVGSVFAFTSDGSVNIIDYLPLLAISIPVFIIIGAIITLIANGMNDSRMRETEPSAYAKLIFIQMGSWDSDDSHSMFLYLTLRFVTEESEIVTTKCASSTALSSVSSYEVGQGYNIRYEKENPSVVMIDDMITTEQSELNRYFYIEVFYGVSRDEIRVRQEGKHALGVVMEAIPTGDIVNDLAQMELALNVIKENGAEFTLKIVKNIHSEFMKFTIPGTVLPIYYESNKEQKAVIWFYDE